MLAVECGGGGECVGVSAGVVVGGVSWEDEAGGKHCGAGGRSLGSRWHLLRPYYRMLDTEIIVDRLICSAAVTVCAAAAASSTVRDTTVQRLARGSPRGQ